MPNNALSQVIPADARRDQTPVSAPGQVIPADAHCLNESWNWRGYTMVGIQDIATAVLVGALVILLGLALRAGLAQIRAQSQGKNPGLDARRDQTPVSAPGQVIPTDAFLDALTPYLYKAIFAGERAILWGFEQADVAVLAADRKKVADGVYDLLPDTLIVDGVPLPISKVKLLVTREIFEQWVKTVYDQTHAFILKNEAYLRSQVDMLKPKLPPGAGA
jgi:hypothetical protein